MTYSEKKPIPKWPDSLPPPTEMTLLPPEHILYRTDLIADENIQGLIHDLFFFTEDKYFLYYEYSSKEIPEGFDAKKLEQYGLLLRKHENFFFRRPWDKDCPKQYSYIRLTVSDIKYPWQQEISDKGPMYGRVQIALMEWRKKEIELARIEALSKRAEDPLLLQPNFFGLGIDIKKISPWIKRIFSKKV